MSNFHSTNYILKIKRGLFANINTTATKNSAVEGEPHYTTDTATTFIYDDTNDINRPVAGNSPYVAKTSAYTITLADSIIDCTGTFSVTILTAVGHVQEFVIKNSGTGIITILTTSGQTLDGYSSGMFYLVQGESITTKSNGSNYIII